MNSQSNYKPPPEPCVPTHMPVALYKQLAPPVIRRQLTKRGSIVVEAEQIDVQGVLGRSNDVFVAENETAKIALVETTPGVIGIEESAASNHNIGKADKELIGNALPRLHTSVIPSISKSAQRLIVF